MPRTCSVLTALILLLSVASCQKFVENKVPVADAGSPKNIIMPDSAVVSGSGTDADGNIVAYLWSQVSGPGNSNILNPGSDSTAIVFTAPGTYLFQLMVTDNKGATGVDTVSIVANAVEIKTLTLQPANNPYEFNVAAIIDINGNTDLSSVATYDLPVQTWPRNGLGYVVRPLIKFDLSSIPASSTIVSADLYLYSYPSPTVSGNLIDANSGPDNAFGIGMITSDWSPSTLTWATQPDFHYDPFFPSTSVPQLDVKANVTSMVSYMVHNNANYGFKLQLTNSNPFYNSRIFVSSHNPNPNFVSKFPKLVVVYKRAN